MKMLRNVYLIRKRCVRLKWIIMVMSKNPVFEKLKGKMLRSI